MADTTEMLDDAMIDPVTGEIIDHKELAERLLAQAKEQGVSLVGPGGLLNQLTKSVLESALNAELKACGRVDQSYSDFVMLAALLAARSSEVSGLQVGDVRFEKNLVVIARQIFPGKGGLVTKPTKSRKERRVPILEPLRPVLERLAEGKEPEAQLLVGPKGGVLTTATVRDATNWDKIVANLGLPDLTRHGLRHTGATWMADAGVPLHVLQEILGHASMETTRGYLHPDDRHLASAAEQANAFLSPAGQKRQNSRSTSSARGL